MKLAEILYYKILENVMAQETRRLHGKDMAVSCTGSCSLGYTVSEMKTEKVFIGRVQIVPRCFRLLSSVSCYGTHLYGN